MVRHKKTKKKPVSSAVDPAAVSRKVTQSTISQFHTLLKQIGGLKAYQEASRLGQADDRGGDSSKILVGWLREGAFAGKGKERESHEKIR
jgi:25S rRNA (adenine2142-N1)-methyltransferase